MIKENLLIPVQDIIKESLEIKLDTERIDFLDEKDAKKIKLHLFINFVSENFVFIKGSVEYFLNKICEKCLERFDTKIIASFDREYEISNNQKYIDLTDDIREEFWLNIPYVYKCSSNCKGLCSRCGENLNFRHCNCNKENFDLKENIFQESFKKFFNKI